jgi:hypothetical protein
MYRGGQRPLLLEVDRKRVFHAFHGLSHLGTQARKALEGGCKALRRGGFGFREESAERGRRWSEGVEHCEGKALE